MLTAVELPSGPVLSTVGGQPVDLRGTEFGFTGLPLSLFSATFGPTGRELSATGCSVFTDRTVVRCFAPVGVGYNFSWILTHVNQTLASSSSLGVAGLSSYASPTIEGISGAAMQTAGGTTFDLATRSTGPVFSHPSWAALGARALINSTFGGPTGTLYRGTSCRVIIASDDVSAGWCFLCRFLSDVNCQPGR